jgi:hypothetical protein
MAVIKMVPVEKLSQSARGVFVGTQGQNDPMFLRGGAAFLRCGRCGWVLARHVNASLFRGVVIQCSECCCYNEMPVSQPR